MEHNNKNYNNRNENNSNYNRSSDMRKMSKSSRSDERYNRSSDEGNMPQGDREDYEGTRRSSYGQRGSSSSGGNQAFQNRSRDNDRNYDANYSHSYDRESYNNPSTDYRSSYDYMSYGQGTDDNNMNRYNYENDRMGSNFSPSRYGSAYGSSSGASSNYSSPDYGSSYTSSRSYSPSEYNSTGTDYRSNYGSSYGSKSSSTSNSTSYAGKGPKGWQRSDENIRERVCDTLERDPSVDASEIEVTVKEGMVTLSGKVDHRSVKRRAEDIIENLPGVKDVRNEISVDQSFFQQAKEMLTGDSSTLNEKSSNRMAKPTTTTSRH